jgi:hypothetical protein
LPIYYNSQEWPEEVYPTYANGPGYVISSDIADSIVSEFTNHKLRVRSDDCFCSACFGILSDKNLHISKILYGTYQIILELLV